MPSDLSRIRKSLPTGSLMHPADAHQVGQSNRLWAPVRPRDAFAGAVVPYGPTEFHRERRAEVSLSNLLASIC